MESRNPQPQSRSALRRQQAIRRKELLTEQMEAELKAQPQMLDAKSFRRADRLAIRHLDRELKRFLGRRARYLTRYWMKFFNRYKRRGRPRKDSEANEALCLHEAGTPWSEIGRAQGKPKDAARKLASLRKRSPGIN